MKRILLYLLIMGLSVAASAQTEKEKVAETYYSGFAANDWAKVSAQLAQGFTFTSPNSDDHITVDRFKEKCWPTAKYFKKVDYIKMAENNDYLMLQVQIVTTDGHIVCNVDVFSFSDSGKIKSIEVFFGAGSKYPGSKGE